jgi:hypothetical protein
MGVETNLKSTITPYVIPFAVLDINVLISQRSLQVEQRQHASAYLVNSYCTFVPALALS